MKTMIVDNIAEKLNTMVRINEEDWRLLLYVTLSPYAPKIKINGVTQRGVLHANMVGEISTAKSSIMRILEKISPKSTRLSKVTNASIEGTVTPGNVIIPGDIEKANDGTFIVPEYTTKLSRMDIMREAMDGDVVRISKRAISWSFNPRVAFIAGSNPKQDFFTKGSTMRNEIPFKEGILSRFDVIIPMINTPDEAAEIVSDMTFFEPEKKAINFKDIKRKFKTLADSMKLLVDAIKMSPEQTMKIKQAYLNHNVEMGNRPRVILRDIESLIRLVNVISAVNAEKTANKRIYQATDEDVDAAIDLWNYMINVRVQMYGILEEKYIKSPEDQVLDIIKENGTIKNKDLIDKAQGICSRKTVFRIINKLEKKGILERLGKYTEEASVILK
jgi:DNA replicative helicase MCM subunit Mcm2 (Cdc46/Mcm family)